MNKEDQEAADLMAVQMYRAENPSLTNTQAILKLMELGIIKLDGEAPDKEILEAQRKKLCPRPKSSDPNVERIYAFMEQHNLSYEDAVIQLSDEIKI